MNQANLQISLLYKNWQKEDPEAIELLPPSGSDRRYFRVLGKAKTVMATFGSNVKENETFIYFSKHFKSLGLNVPEVYCQSDDQTLYFQEDLGTVSLIDILEAEGYTPNVYQLFAKSLSHLAALQVTGHKGLDYSKCLTNKEFGQKAILADLLYFKYYFLDALQKPYDKQRLIDEFEALSNYLSHTEHKYFMFRDFQSRNIMLKKEEIFFIDYQGGMLGAPQYDVASMLWQARANLPLAWKKDLMEHYMNSFEQQILKPLDRDIFRGQYYGYVLIRLLQVLGAYGFRGLFERKAHFLTSIPHALKNLKEFLLYNKPGISLPEFEAALQICTSEETIKRFTPVQAEQNTKLVVKIFSFSYKLNLPVDESDNGGGFTFDCRGILNPGRIEEYKKLTGRDKPVMDFLALKTKMPEFINSAFDMVDISVEDYINRGFESLLICFGCTGGQHRSVYAADAMARHLKNKFKVNIELKHLVQDAKKWVN